MAFTRSSSIGLCWKQLRALLRKSMIVRVVHYVETCFELIFPLLAIYALLYAGIKLPTSATDKQTITETHEPMEYEDNPQPNLSILFDPQIDFPFENGSLAILYTPDNDVTHKLMESFRIENDMYSSVNVSGFQTEGELDAQFEIECKNLQDLYVTEPHKHLFGVYFNSNQSEALNKAQMRYKLRLPIDFGKISKMESKFPDKSDQAPIDDQTIPIHIEVYNRFVKVQSYINRAFVQQTCSIHGVNCDDIFMDVFTGQDKPIHINRMPYPRYRNRDFPVSVPYVMAGTLPFVFIMMSSLIVKRITAEKSTKVKELLRLIGMSDLVFYLAHFLNHFILILVFAPLVTGIMFYLFIVPMSSSLIFAFGFLLWGIQLILFSMFISTIFNRPVLATNVTIIGSIALFIGVISLESLKISGLPSLEDNSIRALTCLLPVGSIFWFLLIMDKLENVGVGLHFSNLNANTTTFGNFTALSVLLIVIGSYFVYVLLIWYLDNVWPFQHGVPKKPWYFVLPSYWSPQECETEYDSSEKPEVNGHNFETEPTDLKATIRIENLCKDFNSLTSAWKKNAVDGLWLNVYENQITVLLGHNGAGKTTTMNMITGMYSATSGSIHVNGHKISTNTKRARQSIGLCPQENIFFADLTVEQHLRLFAALKDYPTALIEIEVENLLDLLKMIDKKNVLATKLSGGMKRKLSLGMALVGETETLILDEPTSGLDPDGRRDIWDLLLSVRRQKTILLTTHYMEEADILGDRIAIMNEGKLCCSGTPHFLKNAFGTGYRLQIAKKDSQSFNSLQFEKVLRRFIPSALLSREIETEVVYTLQNDFQMDKKRLLSLLPEMFDDIEKNKQNYGIDSCGLSYSTLEDVFIAVGSDANHGYLLDREDLVCNDDKDSNNQPILLTNPSEFKRGFALILNQFAGLFLKRINFSRRNWISVITQMMIPVLIFVFAIRVQNSLNRFLKSKSVHLDLNVAKIYGNDTETFVYGHQDYSNSYQRVNVDKYSSVVHSIGNDSYLYLSEVNKLILKVVGDDLDTYIHKFLYGFGDLGHSFEDWINYEQIHSLPLSIQVLFESLLLSVLPQSLKSNASISVESDLTLLPTDSKIGDTMAIIVQFCLNSFIFIPIAFPFLAASYILFPIQEQASKSKLLQLMTGLSPITFWLANFFFDLLNHSIVILIIFGVIYFYDSNHIFISSSILYPLLFSFGIGTIPFVYLFSFRFEKPSNGYSFLVKLFIFLTLFGNIIFGLFDILPILKDTSKSTDLYLGTFGSGLFQILLILFRILPTFSLSFGYLKAHKLSALAKSCSQLSNDTCANIETTIKLLNSAEQNIPLFIKGCCPNICGDFCYQTASPFALNNYGSGQEMIFMITTGLICFLVIILCESYKQKLSISHWIRMIRRSRKEEETPLLDSSGHQRSLVEDFDVEYERIRIANEIACNRKSDLLTVNKLTKEFGHLKAVDELTFGIHHNECFGLLGVNGAGKTTTFSMLTGDLLPSSGNAYIHRGRFGLINNLRQFQRNIGYCPQFDALPGKLTGEETLCLFGRLRGIPAKYLGSDVANLIKMVDLESYCKKRTDTYSGGNRRKLSIAIALIGTPPLLFLDEPSSGVDPAARRKIWQTLAYLKRHFASTIVLTSHSMEECEALCSRIGIMVKGRFQCLGSPQHLRSKYGQGYSVQISLRKEQTDNIQQTDYVNSIQTEMTRVLPSSILKDYHQSLMQFHIADPSERWSNIFRQMAKLNEQFDFEDYVVSDTTLEQIFIRFARQNSDKF